MKRILYLIVVTIATFTYSCSKGNNPNEELAIAESLMVESPDSTEILREKEGGVYTPVVYSSYDIGNDKWYLVYFLQTNEEQSARMLQLADEIFVNLLRDGAAADQFNRVKGALLSQYENRVRTNSYWHDNIRLHELLGIDLITDHRPAIGNLTLDEFNAFMRNLYDGSNRIQVNMHGVAQAQNQSLSE